MAYRCFWRSITNVSDLIKKRTGRKLCRKWMMLILCSLLIAHCNNMLVLYWCMAIKAANVLNSAVAVLDFGLFIGGKPVLPCKFCLLAVLFMYYASLHMYLDI